MPYTQAEKPLWVQTILGDDVLLLDGYRGVEGLSQPFEFTVDLLSEDPAVDGKSILGSEIALATRLPGNEDRFFHGRVRRFGLVEQRDELTAYRAEVVPWLWFLSLSQESRIFQNLSVLQILEQVFSDLGWTDFDIRCTRSYEPREYCVQYRETHLDYVSRLMQEEGIFYYFEHEQEKHTLVIADGNNVFEQVPGGPFRYAPQGAIAEDGEDVVEQFNAEHAVHTSKVSLRDYDYLQPSFDLEAFIEGGGNGTGPREVYDYPGSHNILYKTKEEGDRYARLRLEAAEASHHVVRGEGTCRAFLGGGTFELRDHPVGSSNGEYLLTGVRHWATGGQYRSWGGEGFEYQNSFVCIPADVPFRPERTVRPPIVHGTQTAVVVGKAGEEIWTDKHGRVKVQFHWDREGKKDENSSCWIRVATSWAGKSWGVIHIPRIGQEVVVAFEEGDPDRPLIVGSVYNAEQTPPYALPDNQTQSGLKSRSSKGGSGSNFNEIRMEDKKGKEQLYIHAEKDQQIVVENNRTDSVGNDETRSVGRDQTASVERDHTGTVGRDRKVKVGKDDTLEVSADQSIRVDGDRKDVVGVNEKRDVGANQDLAVGGNRKVSVSGNEDASAGGNMKHGADANLELSSGAATEASAGTSVKISAGTTMELSAGVSIKLSAGGSSIEIGPAGVKITTAAMVTVQGSMIKLN